MFVSQAITYKSGFSRSANIGVTRDRNTVTTSKLGN